MTRLAYFAICTVIFAVAMAVVMAMAKWAVGTWGAWIAIPICAFGFIVALIWDRKEKAEQERASRRPRQTDQS